MTFYIRFEEYLQCADGECVDFCKCESLLKDEMKQFGSSRAEVTRVNT